MKHTVDHFYLCTYVYNKYEKLRLVIPRSVAAAARLFMCSRVFDYTTTTVIILYLSTPINDIPKPYSSMHTISYVLVGRNLGAY